MVDTGDLAISETQSQYLSHVAATCVLVNGVVRYGGLGLGQDQVRGPVPAQR